MSMFCFLCIFIRLLISTIGVGVGVNTTAVLHSKKEKIIYTYPVHISDDYRRSGGSKCHYLVPVFDVYPLSCWVVSQGHRPRLSGHPVRFDHVRIVDEAVCISISCRVLVLFVFSLLLRLPVCIDGQDDKRESRTSEMSYWRKE
ncbi:hypothetical protein V8F06_009681 [Rhypophila decipiens]